MSNLCFPTVDDVSRLNDLATQIDARLYLYAYFNPKTTVNMTWEYIFWINVTNLYSLYHDCGYPVKNIINYVFNQLLSRDELTLVNNHLKKIEYFRSFYCHNFDEQIYYFDKLRYNRISYIIKTILGEDYTLRELMKNTHEDNWKQLCKGIVSEATQVMNLLELKLNEIKESSNIENIKNHWLDLIANWYPASYVDGVLNHMFDLREAKSNRRHQTPSYTNYKKSIIEHWKEQYSDTWKLRYPSIIHSMSTSAYPNEAIALTVYKEIITFNL